MHQHSLAIVLVLSLIPMSDIVNAEMQSDFNHAISAAAKLGLEPQIDEERNQLMITVENSTEIPDEVLNDLAFYADTVIGCQTNWTIDIGQIGDLQSRIAPISWSSPNPEATKIEVELTRPYWNAPTMTARPVVSGPTKLVLPLAAALAKAANETTKPKLPAKPKREPVAEPQLV